MIVLSVELCVLFILYIFSKKYGKQHFWFWGAMVLVAVAGLRSSGVGPDGLVYAQYFEDLKKLSYEGIYTKFNKEPLFYVVTKVFQEFGITLQVWYALIGALFSFSIMFIINQYSKNEMISILALFSLGYYVFSFTGLRQTVALAIVIFSVWYIERKKYIKAILVIGIASMFHNSALVFLIVIFIWDRKIKIWQYITILIVSLGAVVLFEQQVHNFLSETIEEIERFENYAGYDYGLSWAGFVIQCMIFGFALILYKGKHKQMLLNISFMGVLFQILAVLMAEFFRLSMYFNAFNVVLLGNVYCENRFAKNSRQLARVLIVGVLLLYFINSHWKYEYIFYWQ